MVRDLSGLESTSQTSIVAAARALARDAAAGRAALVASRPLSARGKRVKAESIAGFTAAQAVARNRLELVRLAPQRKTAAKRIAALTKTYKANRTRWAGGSETRSRRPGSNSDPSPGRSGASRPEGRRSLQVRRMRSEAALFV